MRRLISVVLCMFMMVPAFAKLETENRQVVNIEYVNQRLKDVPIGMFDVIGYSNNQYYGAEGVTFQMALNSMLSEAEQKQVANVEYLLKSIDRVNEALNGYKATDFGESKYATSQAVNIASVDDALKRLVGIYYPFSYTTVENVTETVFMIGAAGLYWIDWGDGSVQLFYKENPEGMMEVGHQYASAGTYKVKLGGKASAYGAMEMDLDLEQAPPAVMFGPEVYTIKGSLGKIFSTLPDGTNPYYLLTFAMCENITGEIPEDLFDGNTGSPSTGMFFGTFADGQLLMNGNMSGKPRFTGSIPEKLFDGFSGRTNWAAFAMTFMGNFGLTGKIPEKLFASIESEPGNFTFMFTFAMCPMLQGPIPEKLFAGFKGAPDQGILMFAGTFAYCYSLTGSIPAGLFAGIKGQPGYGMFMSTFTDCPFLSGTIPADLFAGISGEPVDMVFSGTFAGCSSLSGIGGPLFANMTGSPYTEAFRGTFYNCSGLKGGIPDGMFGDLGCGVLHPSMTSSDPVPSGHSYCYVSGSAFYETFYGCTGLNGQSATALGPDGKYYPLYELNFNHKNYDFSSMYYNDKSLEDYSSIPCTWGGPCS